MPNSVYFVFSQLESPLHLGLALLVGGLFLSTVVTHSGDQFGQKEVSGFSCNLEWCILSDNGAVIFLCFACALWFVLVKFHCVWGWVPHTWLETFSWFSRTLSAYGTSSQISGWSAMVWTDLSPSHCNQWEWKVLSISQDQAWTFGRRWNLPKLLPNLVTEIWWWYQTIRVAAATQTFISKGFGVLRVCS